MFAKRTNWLLTPNKISLTLQSLKDSKEKILDLTESNPTRCGYDYPKESILSSLTDEENLRYAPCAKGNKKAREALSQFFHQYRQCQVDPGRIFLTSSTSEGYSFLFRLLANPKESVLFPIPSYPLFPYLVDLNDIHLLTYPLSYEDSWRIDLKALTTSLRKSTKAIVLVNPNNPTGSFVKKEELKTINHICRENKMAIISDEVFFDYPFVEDKSLVTLVNNEENLTFILGGVSKSLGLPQMKVSWIMINGPKAKVAEAIHRLEMISDTYLSVATPSQNALESWLGLHSVIHTQIMNRLKHNRTFLQNLLLSYPHCRVLDSQGGWYAILKLPERLTEEQWVLTFLKEDLVFVHPGYFFDFIEEPFIVLSLLPQPENFKEGLTRILARVARCI